MRKVLLLTLLIALILSSSWGSLPAQTNQRIIRGTVSDENAGIPRGASVKEKNTIYPYSSSRCYNACPKAEPGNPEIINAPILQDTYWSGTAYADHVGLR